MNLPKKSLSYQAFKPYQKKLMRFGLTKSSLRLVSFLLIHNGAKTPEIVECCDIRNVSDVVKKNKDRLSSAGLNIECVMTDRKNVFGDVVPVGSWFLEIEDPSVFFGVRAAND